MVVAMPKFNVQQKLIDRLNLVSREILQGIPVIRAFSREEREKERFEEANRKLPESESVCQPVHDLYDAGDDVYYERHYRAHRV